MQKKKSASRPKSPKRPAPRKQRKRKPRMARKKAPVANVDTAWFHARMLQLGLTQNALGSLLFDRSQSIIDVLEGSRQIRLFEIADMCRALRVPPLELMRRLGYPPPGIPVTGRVLADGRVSPVVDKRKPHPSTLGDYPGDATALLISAPTGDLAPYDGGVVVYMPNPADDDFSKRVGKLCVIEDIGRELPVLGILGPSSSKSIHTIIAFGSGAKSETTQIVRASPVLGLHLKQSLI